MRAITAVILLALAGLAYVLGARSPEQAAPQPGAAPAALVEVTVPDILSADARVGKTAFEAKCAVCHGLNGVGQEGLAPPLVHKIYEPSHHGDAAFQLAVAQGVRQHHWPFGNMPPVEGLTRADVGMIIAYIRELQQANGIQ